MENEVPDQILSSPGALADTIHAMARGEDPDTTISPQEAEALTADIEEARAVRGKRQNENSHQWAPRGEGGSGNRRVTQLEPQSKSVLTDPSVDEDDVQSCADPRENDTEPPEPTPPIEDAVPTSGVGGPVHQQDLDDLIAGLDEMTTERNSALRADMMAEIEKLRQLFDSVQRTISSLSVRVSNCEVKQNRQSQTAVLQPPVQLPGASSRPVTPAGASSGVTSPPAKRASIASAPSADSHVQTVSRFLADTPTYPKIKTIRAAKLTRLAADLGFVLRSPDLPPTSWNVDGIMRHLTKD